jgi:S1-C subfamily serine protease
MVDVMDGDNPEPRLETRPADEMASGPGRGGGKGRSSIWSAVAYFAGVGALVAVLIQLAPAVEAPEPGAATTTTVRQVDVQAPSFLDGDEPIADAAEVILPSVVFIQTSSGLGSGVVYDAERGLIITAAHVVGGDETVRVRFNDGEQVTGRVLGSATGVDIAVIEVDEIEVPSARFSDEKPRVGQLAIAVGSPWGLASTVTAGIISAVDQTNCGLDTCVSMVQTDAAINPGNSGGALIDRDGEVVGINVSIYTLSGANDGVGFAVPSEIAVDYAESIATGEAIETSFLGVSVENATTGRAGALITEVVPGSAAEEAGLELGDVVIRLGGVTILSQGDLVAQVRAHRPGTTVEVVVLRDSAEMTLDITLGVRVEEPS